MIKKMITGFMLCVPMIISAQLPATTTETNKTDIGSVPPEKKIAIEQLIDLTGSLSIVSLFTETYVVQILQTMNDKGKTPSDSVKRTILKEADKLIEKEVSVKGGFKDYLCLVYHKHFTHEEIKKILAFYTSDIGKKLLKELPNLQQEGMQATEIWGQSVGPKIYPTLKKNLLAKGIKLPEL